MRDYILSCFIIMNKSTLMNCDLIKMTLSIKSEKRLLSTFEALLPILYGEYPHDVIFGIENKETQKKAIDIYIKFSSKNSYIIKEILKKIDNDDYKIELLEKYKEYLIQGNFAEIVTTFDSDEIKKNYIPRLTSTANRVTIIKSLKNDYYKQEYAHDDYYQNHKAEIISSYENKELLIKEINKLDKNTANQIVDFLPRQILIRIASRISKSSQVRFEKFKENFVPSYVDSLNDSIDPRITFGVELEANNHYKEFILKMHDIAKYNIKKDGSVDKGCEITSPILHYTEKDIEILKTICDAMNESDFYIDNTCGGHIHIGFNYFKTPEEVLNFLRIYANCERIIYLISNKAGESERTGVSRYAKHIANKYADILNTDDEFFNMKDMEALKAHLYRAVEDRYYGLNFKNLIDIGLGTIEFRMPNGQIDFDELHANIKLFLLLVQRSKEITYLSKFSYYKEYVDTLQNEIIDDDDKLEILLDILFQNNEKEKEIYRERYNKNKDLHYGDFNKKNILIKGVK